MRAWVPGAVAAALLAVVVLPRIGPAPESERQIAALAAEDIEILLGEEDFEMLAELEFYEWLDLQQDVVGDEGGDGIG